MRALLNDGKMRRFLIASGIIVAVFAGLVITQTLLSASNTSNITTPANLIVSPESINWGALGQGQSVYRAVTLTNAGQQTTAPLIMISSATVGILTWDAENLTIPAGASLTVNFSLKVWQTVEPGPFTFDITLGY